MQNFKLVLIPAPMLTHVAGFAAQARIAMIADNTRVGHGAQYTGQSARMVQVIMTGDDLVEAHDTLPMRHRHDDCCTCIVTVRPRRSSIK